MWINKSRENLILTFKYSETLLPLVRSLTGRKYDAARKRWIVPLDHVIETVDLLSAAGFTSHIEVMRAYQRSQKSLEKIQAVKKDSSIYAGKLPLFEFQKIGAGFIRYMYCSLIGDSPGLGKTLQTIAALEFDKRVLVFCPATLKYSWEEEIKKWEPETLTLVVDGSKQERDLSWALAEKGVKKYGDIFYPKYTIANYELLLRDYAEIKKVPWDVIVSDEATRISNPEAKSVRALKALSRGKRIALTGTPVANTAIDLWSIIDWLRPGYLGTFSQFKDRFTISDVWGGIRAYRDLDVLSKMVEPFLLRRTKEEVMKDLPAKTFERISFHLSGKERHLYEALVKQIADEIKNLDFNKSTLAIIPVKMLRLLQMVDDPRLLGSDIKSSKLETLKDILEPILYD